jgi:alpha-L-fucosidase
MSEYQVRNSPGNTKWFVHDRFGMFIHWGLYSMAARHEWIKQRESIAEEAYQKYFDHFDPDLFDPKEWARQAKAAGMKYAVLTAKHHEGFCLWDTKYSEYKSTNTRAGRDLVREYVDAFRAQGLRVGLYYSLLDWHHPDFTIDCLHPRKGDADALEQNKGRDMKRYARYMRDQVTELLTCYGKIDVLWFDFSYDHYAPGDAPELQRGKGREDWEAEKLIETVRAIQPDIVINNRTEVEQDIWTPEQYQPQEWVRHEKTGELVTWEACHTFSGSWGYYRDEQTWKSPEILIRLLVGTVALGGNLLMNVGPTARGYFDKRAQNALAIYEKWMKYHDRSIYGCTMADPDILSACPADCRLTQSQDGKRLYLHLFAYPFKNIQLKGLAGRVRYAQFLHDGSELKYTEHKNNRFNEGITAEKEEKGLLVIDLPPVKPDVIIPVIELILR